MNTFITSFQHRRQHFLVLLCVFLGIQFLLVPLVNAQDNLSISDFWKDTEFLDESLPIRTSPLPSEYRRLSLEIESFSSLLKNAPQRFLTNDSDVFISIPLLNGELEHFQVFSAPVFDENLAKKFPDLSSYSIKSINNELITGRINITSNGIYALVINPEQGMIYIEPYSRENSKLYIAYNAKNLGTAEQHEELTCEVHNEINEAEIAPLSTLTVSDCQLRRFRFTLSATGEYTQWHGGTVEQAMGKIMVLTANVNAVLEREIGVTLELVDGNELLVFTNPDTDPFTGDNRFAMLEENPAVVSSLIGYENVDLGMVVAITGGGATLFNSVCNISRVKGTAGNTWSPEGYPLESVVIHEIGHKFGARHSFNSSCNSNRNSATAFEPGSGSSIMSYAGACAPSVTYPRENYFHVSSLEAISSFLEGGINTSCGEIISVGNIAGFADAGIDRTLPLETPFELVGENTNPDNDAQSFSWDQMDNEIASMPPNPNMNKGPSFRSFYPKATAARSFPSFECLASFSSSVNCEWEVLPEVPRTINLEFVVREMHEGIGCWQQDDIVLNFIDTGSPFAITHPNGGEVFDALGGEEIEWNVSQTNISPINCPTVNISLSIDGGRTFPYILATETNNDGAAFIEFPDVNSENCFIRISGNDHVFFDLSDTDFSIKKAPIFSLHPVNSSYSFCEDAPNSVSFEIEITAEDNFNENVVFPASDNTGNLSISFSPNIISPPGLMTVEILGDLNAGENTITVTGTSNSHAISTDLFIYISDESVGKVILETPEQDLIETELDLILEWGNLENTLKYEVELATSPTFQNPVISTIIEDDFLEIKGLNSFKTYYWHVRGINGCGNGPWSEIFAFRTKEIICTNYIATNTPREIIGNEPDDAFALINVVDNYPIYSASIVDLVVEHTHVGDLSSRIISPTGEFIELFYRPGLNDANPYGCVRDDLNISFSDAASNTYEEMWNTCESDGAAISGEFQALQAFSSFEGEQSEGIWLFNLNDLTASNGGDLLNVTLNLCREDIQPNNNLSISSEILHIDQYENAIIDENLISTSSNSSIFQLIELPQNGALLLNGSLMNIGDTFTKSNLENNDFHYLHEGNFTVEDSFKFDATNSSEDWSGIEEFFIDITLLAPIPTIYINDELDCSGDNNASIGVSLQFGTPPFLFSLDGVEYQEDNDFYNLSAGTYSIFVSDEAGYNIESTEITIGNPEPVFASLEVIESTITVTSEGGTGSYTYQLNDADFQTSNVFTVSQDDEYFITVLDENGCTFEISTLINNLQISIELSQNISCNNGSDGVIVAQTFGGIAPFQYKLNEGFYQDENIFSNLNAGLYEVTVLDATGLVISSNSITIGNPQTIEANISVTGYELVVNAENDFAPFLYSFDGNEFVESNVYQGAPSSSYEVIVQNSLGCTETFFTEVTTVAPSISSLQNVEISCFDENDGQITVVPFQGVAPYEYRLEGFDFQNSNIFSNLLYGVYTFDIRDAGGFISETQSIELINPELITISAQSIAETIEITANGGTGNLTYSIDGEEYQESSTFLNFGTGIYTVFVRDENGCEESIEFTHNTNSFAVTTEMEVLSPCIEITPITVEVCINGGISPYEISSFPAANLITEVENEDCVIFYELEFDQSIVGDIEIMTSDALGNEFTNILDVPEFEILSFIYELNENELSVVATSGTPPYQFSVDGISFQEGGYFPDLENGEYTIHVLDSAGCEDETTILVDHTDTGTTDSPYPDLELLFTIYPNPTNNIAQLEMTRIEGDEVHLTIYNTAGNKMKSENISSQDLPFIINLENFPSGVYQVIVEHDNKIGREKLVLIR